MNKVVLFLCPILFAASAVQAKLQIIQSDIFYELSKGNTKAVKAWLKSKPDLSVKNEQGQTLLHAATIAGKNDIVKMLAKAGIAMNVVDHVGKTALDYAVELNQNSIAFKLVKNKAKLTTLANQEHLRQMYKKRYKKLYWIFGGLIIGAIVLFVIVFSIFIYLPWITKPNPDHVATGVTNFVTVMGNTGFFGLAGTATASLVRRHQSYLLN